MSRYVDADAFVKLIDHYILHDEDAKKNHSALFIDGMKDGYYRIRSNIIHFPSADVVEVVRCKDCKHKEHCYLWSIAFGDIDFCSYGEWKKYQHKKPTSIIAQQWIPCSERLPKQTGEYIVTILFGNVRWTDKFGYTPTKNGGWYDPEKPNQNLINWNESVIAWMPLPEPWGGVKG